MTAEASEVQAVLGPRRIDGQTHAPQAALDLVGVRPWQGKIVTAEARFPHRDFCVGVREGGGDSLRPVQDNPPPLLTAIQAVVADPPAGLSPPPGAVA